MATARHGGETWRHPACDDALDSLPAGSLQDCQNVPICVITLLIPPARIHAKCDNNRAELV